jgi:hypothetical protein
VAESRLSFDDLESVEDRLPGNGAGTDPGKGVASVFSAGAPFARGRVGSQG